MRFVNDKGELRVPPLVILGLIFICLKLTAHIDWPWEVVLLPLYGPPLLAASLVVVMVAWGLITGRSGE